MVAPSRSMKIAPSILAADFAEPRRRGGPRPARGRPAARRRDGRPLRAEPHDRRAGGGVPAPRTDLYLDCHLMIDNPGDLLDDFAKAGADSCTVHVELGDPRPLFDRMRPHGMRVGLVLNPETPLDAVVPYLERDRHPPLHERAPRLRWAGVHPRGARQAARRARRSSTSAASRSSSRSTAASTSRPRRSRPPPAPTSSWRAARSSTRPTPRRGRTRDPRRGVAMRRVTALRGEGPHRLRRRRRGRREDKSGRALVARLTEAGCDVVEHRVIADGIDRGRAARCAS